MIKIWANLLASWLEPISNQHSNTSIELIRVLSVATKNGIVFADGIKKRVTFQLPPKGQTKIIANGIKNRVTFQRRQDCMLLVT